MATLLELNGLLDDPDLKSKVNGALLKAAVAVKFEDPGTTNHAARSELAGNMLTDPQGLSQRFMRYVVGANASSSLSTIQGLSDGDIQDHVNAAIDLFI